MSRDPAKSSLLARAFAVCGGVLFVASLVYFAVSYAGRFGLDAGPWTLAQAWLPAFINFELFTTFATHHSVFARTGLKAWIQRTAPPVLERSIYVWVASLLFLLACGFWRPVPGHLWAAEGPARLVLFAVQIAGGILTLVSAAGLDNLSLAGVRQVLEPDTAAAAPRLNESGPFSLVRHPIYLGWFVLVWATPVMNGTRFTFAAISCIYLVLAIPFEERDLRRMFGSAYDAYARRVRWRVVPWIY